MTPIERLRKIVKANIPDLEIKSTEGMSMRDYALTLLDQIEQEDERMAATIDGLCSASTDEEIKRIELKEERQELVGLGKEMVACRDWWKNESTDMEIHTKQELLDTIYEFGDKAKQWLTEHGELGGKENHE